MIGIAVVVVRQMEMVGRQKYTCEINSVFKKKKMGWPISSSGFVHKI